MIPARNASVPRRASTPPVATATVPRPTPPSRPLNSRRASRTSSRTSAALPSARSRRRVPSDRWPSLPCTSRRSVAMTRSLLLEGLAQEIADADRDEQRAGRVLADLRLDRPLEVAVAQHVGRALHPAGEAVGEGGHLVVAGDCLAADAGELVRAAALTQLLGARLEPVGEGGREVARLLLQ